VLPIQNWQPIVPLPIQKSTTKNFVAADSEINSQTVALPIQNW
jgi:hypothetical protein